MAKSLKPVYSAYNHATGEWTWGLEEDDFNRAAAGYACTNCLEGFDHWVPVCYVCGHPNVPDTVELPSSWRKQGE